MSKEHDENQAYVNTDRELWREREGDYYADSIHVTKRGGIGINCGGTVFVRPIRTWHALAAASVSKPPASPAESNADRQEVEDGREAQAAITPKAPAVSAPTPGDAVALPWSAETMKIINRMTPDIKGKAFDPDWFLLRQRFEDFERGSLSSAKSAGAQEQRPFRWFVEYPDGRHIYLTHYEYCYHDGYRDGPTKDTPLYAAASAKAVEQTHAELDLAMMLRRMIWQINKMDGDSSLKGLAIGAMQLLKKYQLEGSPLRAAAASEQRGGSDK